jgi:hypothetical protein
MAVTIVLGSGLGTGFVGRSVALPWSIGGDFASPLPGHWTPELCLRKRTVPLLIVFTHPLKRASFDRFSLTKIIP